ncbi:hypothetical protein [Oceanirhabdus sp. W0125-5]|uniref:hypothetical protein n=1 Tax=Oceanirhabdus sp. W0125-5 TaxID=2999116 RepID=UPI0022F2FEF0|nr:hypothetical protein [Oceanirhabdus sp. W0125-5]WBW96086.1 hypothetical protein OW730_20680 [Oceanirhabdus sp. W0125-5]
MEKNSLDILGQSLMKYVRDETILTWDKMIEGDMKGVTAQKVEERLSNFSEEDLESVKWIISKIVDQGLHNLLAMFEECEELFLGVKVDSGEIEDIKEESDGLSGELYTEDGWITKFSKQRYDEEV